MAQGQDGHGTLEMDGRPITQADMEDMYQRVEALVRAHQARAMEACPLCAQANTPEMTDERRVTTRDRLTHLQHAPCPARPPVWPAVGAEGLREIDGDVADRRPLWCQRGKAAMPWEQAPGADRPEAETPVSDPLEALSPAYPHICQAVRLAGHDREVHQALIQRLNDWLQEAQMGL